MKPRFHHSLRLLAPRSLYALALALAALPGCFGAHHEAWKRASEIGTAEEYQRFIELFPESKKLPVAQERLAEVEATGFPFPRIRERLLPSEFLGHFELRRGVTYDGEPLPEEGDAEWLPGTHEVTFSGAPGQVLEVVSEAAFEARKDSIYYLDFERLGPLWLVGQPPFDHPLAALGKDWPTAYGISSLPDWNDRVGLRWTWEEDGETQRLHAIAVGPEDLPTCSVEFEVEAGDHHEFLVHSHFLHRELRPETSLMHPPGTLFFPNFHENVTQRVRGGRTRAVQQTLSLHAFVMTYEVVKTADIEKRRFSDEVVGSCQIAAPEFATRGVRAANR